MIVDINSSFVNHVLVINLINIDLRDWGFKPIKTQISCQKALNLIDILSDLNSPKTMC